LRTGCDLHPRNVLIEKGRLTGVIDWGDLARGDRASDLASTWMLLPELASRKRAMAACHSVSDATWRRARMVAIGERTIGRLWEGP
jgi:aminoglycoside phosphotransferase (APT) family kinase protein